MTTNCENYNNGECSIHKLSCGYHCCNHCQNAEGVNCPAMCERVIDIVKEEE